MEPRHLGVRVVLVKSFARIHETNLKKQGILGLTFKLKSDYKKILEDDIFEFLDLNNFSPGIPLKLELNIIMVKEMSFYVIIPIMNFKLNGSKLVQL